MITKVPAATLKEGLFRLDLMTHSGFEAALVSAQLNLHMYEIFGKPPYHGSQDAGYQERPGLIPLAKLVEAYAHTGLGQQGQALKVVNSELHRITMDVTPNDPHLYSNADAILAFQVALGTILTSTEGRMVRGQVSYERAANFVAANQPRQHDRRFSGLDQALWSKSRFYEIVNHYFRHRSRC